MHELSVTESILSIALNAAAGRRVSAINLLIGDLSSFVDDSVQFYFDLLSKGTLAEDALLHFERRPAEGACADCGHRFTARPPLTSGCPACGSQRVQITGGRELRVESIEVADGD